MIFAAYITATSTFASTTGFTWEQVISYATSSVLRLYIGTAVSTLYYLRGWLIAAFVIGCIIYFAFAAMAFFRH